MKKVQRNSFKLNPIAASIVLAMSTQLAVNVAQAGSGTGSGVNVANSPVAVSTYYANSPSGPAPQYVNGVMQVRTDGSALPVTAQSGTMLRKFVDTLPGFGSANANNLGQYIPIAAPSKWVDPNGVTTGDDYYEIAAVEFRERMHSDLPAAGTHLRGYVQLETATNAATSKHIALTYPNGNAITDPAKVTATNTTGQVYAYDSPHHLGPVINSTKGTVVRVKFTNYLPIGGKMFLPVDPTIPGAGFGPDGVTSYTQNRAGMHLVGGQAPWISAGSPHQWVAPAGEAAAYAAGLGKGSSAQSATDMLDPGNGSVNLVFPNDMSARFTFIQDRTSGMTRLNAYAGLEAGYVVRDPIEQTMVTGGTLTGGGLGAKTVTVAKETIPSAELPLIIEDKTFVPANISQQDSLWDTVNWGAPGDLWFPHVYETNQDPTQAGGTNPVGRWDYGPMFWPIFPVHPAKATLPATSFVPEAYMDTPLVNGTAYPKVTVEPKAYRVRVLNGSNDRYYNLGLYLADPTAAPQLDANGNPIVNAAGVQQYLANTEVKMVPASAIDAAGSPPGWDVVNGVQLPLPQFGTTFPWNINAEPSGPTRAWPVDSRVGGSPDPTTSGPDFVVIGNDGGLLPQATDIPSQPITYEQNRRSITVTNIYGYGLLLGPSERADTIVDFSAFAGKTLILFNDAPAPTPFTDPRNDYFTGDADQTAQGGAYSTLPGYGPNTRTIMQITVGTSVTSGGPLNAANLAAALPAAYAASQPAPIVPETAYNAAFGTTDTDTYGRVSTGSAADPNLIANHSAGGGVVLTDFSLTTSGGTGTGSGSGYTTPPQVQLIGGGGTGATASSTINTVGQVSAVKLTSAGSGYTSAPSVLFVPNSSISGVVVNDGGQNFVAPVTVTLSGGGLAAPYVVPAAKANVSLTTATAVNTAPASVTLLSGGSGYLVPPTVAFAPASSGATATGVATISTSPLLVGATTSVGTGTVNYTNPVAVVSASQNGTTASASPIVGYSLPAANTVITFAAPVTSVVSVGAGFDLASVVVNFAPAATQDPTVTAVLPTATVTLDPSNGAALGITILTPGSGMTALPTATISDGSQQSATVPAASIAFAPATGKIFGANITAGGTGYTAPATITFTDATGSGASFTANPAGAVGSVTGLTITAGGTGYVSTPAVSFIDKTTGLIHPAGATAASASVSLATSPGSINSVVLTGLTPSFTSVPTISFSGAGNTGTGALATVGIAPQGVGAQATVLTSTSVAIPVLTKAEQELYDDWGRYNSTGGVELPFTTAAIQTTIPLNFIDAPTEILGDDEMQVWKLVDNGFWSNSIHFSGWDVQLINRVGWDGTVKAPATNEVGWKDTVRLNPLEDVLVAMRAKVPSVNFGQPRSTRLQDPSKPTGTANYPTAPAMAVAGTQYASGMGFTADPNVVTQASTMNSKVVGAGVVLLATSTNTAALVGSTTGNYDNEFDWGSVILGHSENDFTRSVVFNPIVNTPSTPQGFGDTTGVGTLSWTDPTPVALATTKANPQNEIGFKVLQAPLTLTNGKYVAGAFAPAAVPISVPANVVSYKEPAALVSPTPPNNQFYAYQVVAYNAAGDSAPSTPWNEAPPDAPTSLGLTPSWAPQAVASTGDVQIVASWIDNAINETNYVVTRTGGVGATASTLGGVTTVTGGSTTVFTIPANIAGGSTTTTLTDTPTGVTASTGAVTTTGTWTAAVEGAWYEYDVVATNSFGKSTPILSASMQAPVYRPLAPTNVATGLAVVVCPAAVPSQCAPDDVVLTWTDNAINETFYDIWRNGALIASVPGNALNVTGAMTYTDHTATESAISYNYAVSARNAVGSSVQVAAAALPLPYMPTTLPTNVVATPSVTLVNNLYPDTVALTWNDNAYTENSYQVTRTVVAPSPASLIGQSVSYSASGNGANNPLGTKTANWAASPQASFGDTGLVDGLTYTWTIAGVNSLGAGPATSITQTMPGVYIIPPTNLRATPNRAGGNITLTWLDNSTNETDFLVEEQVSANGVAGTFYNTTATGTVGTTLGGWTALPAIARAAGSLGTVTFNRGGIPTTTGLVYNFRVSARNLASHSDSHPYLTTQASLSAPVFTYAPTLSAPTLAATGRVALTWTAVPAASIPANTTISYLVFANGAQIGRTNAATFNYRPTVAQLQAGISYTVQAVATAIRVANPTVFGSTAGPLSNAMPLAPVAVPTALTAAPTASAPVAAGGGYTSNLTWPSVTGATGYLIQPTLNGVAQAAINVGVLAGTTQTRAVNLVAGNFYTFTVAVLDQVGTSAPSPAVTVNTPAAGNTGLGTVLGLVGSKAITVNWTNTSVNLKTPLSAAFTVQRRTVSAAGAVGAWVTITPTITAVTATTYTFTDATGVAGTGYSYHILANGAGGASAYSAATARAVAP